MLVFIVFLVSLKCVSGQLEGLGFGGFGDFGTGGFGDTQNVGVTGGQDFFQQFNFQGAPQSVSTFGGHSSVSSFGSHSSVSTFGDHSNTNTGRGSELNSAIGIGGLAGSLLGSNLESFGNIGIPSEDSITQLGRAISQGGVPTGDNGEISSPTPHPPPGRHERRVGIAARLFGGGFLNRRR